MNKKHAQEKRGAVGAMPPNPVSLKTQGGGGGGWGGVAYKDRPPPPRGDIVPNTLFFLPEVLTGHRLAALFLFPKPCPGKAGTYM